MKRFETPGSLRLWHGSSAPLARFDGDAIDGTVHLGTLDQAAMRSGGRHLHLVEVTLGKMRRVRDTGSDRRESIAKARRSGYDGLVYLNRYEGISAAQLTDVLDRNPSCDLDRISDASFRKLFPEARDSFLSFDPHACRIIACFQTLQEAREFLEQENLPSESPPASRGPWHVRIDYDEGDPKSYRGVEASCGETRLRFSGKSPQGDWADYISWAKKHEILALTSSSVTHFCWDVPGWRFIDDGEGAEILVPEDRPEWIDHGSAPGDAI